MQRGRFNTNVRSRGSSNLGQGWQQVSQGDRYLESQSFNRKPAAPSFHDHHGFQNRQPDFQHDRSQIPNFQQHFNEGINIRPKNISLNTRPKVHNSDWQNSNRIPPFPLKQNIDVGLGFKNMGQMRHTEKSMGRHGLQANEQFGNTNQSAGPSRVNTFHGAPELSHMNFIRPPPLPQNTGPPPMLTNVVPPPMPTNAGPPPMTPNAGPPVMAPNTRPLPLPSNVGLPIMPSNAGRPLMPPNAGPPQMPPVYDMMHPQPNTSFQQSNLFQEPKFSQDTNGASLQSQRTVSKLQPPPQLPHFHQGHLKDSSSINSLDLITQDSKQATSNLPKVQPEKSQSQTQLDQWLLDRGISRSRKPTQSSLQCRRISIPEFKLLLKEYFKCLQQLKQQKLKLSMVCNENENLWQKEMKGLEMAKRKLHELQTKMNDEETLQNVKRKLQQVRKKRVSIKRRRQREYQVKMEEDERRSVLIEQLNEEIAKEEQQKIQDKQDAEMQKEIDCALHEVRQKKRDISNTQAMLRACKKLRGVRREMSIQKGVPVLACDDALFADKIQKLEAVLQERSIEYREEEKILQVMLEGEQEELKAKENERKAKKEAERVKKRLQERREFLFGKDEEDISSMGMIMYKEFFTQSEREIQTLVDIRKQWDAYLVPEDHPEGSSIPLQWVIPTEPSSKVWTTALDIY